MGTLGEVLFSYLSRLVHYWPFSWRSVSTIILGILLAKWTWVLFAPHVIYTTALPNQLSDHETGQLFGIAQKSEGAEQGIALPNVQLIGVFTPSAGKSGFAILKLDNRQLGIAEGEEIAPGTKLIEVHAGYIVLERAGVQQRVNLENKYTGSPNSAQIMSLPAYNSTLKRSQ